jgi:hypothetical protein
MKKAAAGANAGSRREVRSVFRQLAVALACCVAATGAWSQEAAPLEVASAPDTSMRMEVTTSSLPRLDTQTGAAQAPRLDLSLLPQRRSAVGLALGMSSQSPSAAVPSTFAGTPRTAVDLGVHLRHTTDSDRQFDVTAWRRVNPEPDAYTLIQRQQPVYGARVEMRLAQKKSGLKAELGFIGMQLEGGAKISIRRKNGVPMVYYRNTF